LAAAIVRDSYSYVLIELPAHYPGDLDHCGEQVGVIATYLVHLTLFVDRLDHRTSLTERGRHANTLILQDAKKVVGVAGIVGIHVSPQSIATPRAATQSVTAPGTVWTCCRSPVSGSTARVGDRHPH